MRKITGNGLGCPVRPLSRSGVILGVILGVVYLILMIEMVMGGDSYEQRFRGDPYIADDPAKYSLLRAP